VTTGATLLVLVVVAWFALRWHHTIARDDHVSRHWLDVHARHHDHHH
jgi:hypothetical protein